MMKKISLILLSAAVLIGFTACEKKKEPATQAPVEVAEQKAPENKVAEEEETTPPEPEKTPEEMLKGFKEFIVAYADANNNKSKNIKKYTELAQQSQQWVKDMESIKGQFNDKQLKSYQKLIEELTKINTIK